MKKNTIIGVMLSIITLGDLLAQSEASVSGPVTTSFEKNFAGATRVNWTSYKKDIAVAQFNYLEGSWIAYFGKDGSLISRGRKVKSMDELPIQALNTLLNVKQSKEEKYGAVTVGVIYEMVKDGSTGYFVPMQNEHIYLMFSITPDGEIVLRRKKALLEQPRPSKNAIAKKN